MSLCDPDLRVDCCSGVVQGAQMGLEGLLRQLRGVHYSSKEKVVGGLHPCFGARPCQLPRESPGQKCLRLPLLLRQIARLGSALLVVAAWLLTALCLIVREAGYWARTWQRLSAVAALKNTAKRWAAAEAEEYDHSVDDAQWLPHQLTENAVPLA